MDGSRIETGDLWVRPRLSSLGKRYQEVQRTPKRAAIRRAIAPHVNPDAFAKRRQLEEGRQVENAVVPGDRSLELSRLPSIEFDLPLDPLTRSLDRPAREIPLVREQ